jgi:hypothetical protein
MTIIKHNDKAFGVLRQVPMHHFAERLDTQPNGEYVNMFKQWCGADTIIQSETHFMFCETIPDVEFENVD